MKREEWFSLYEDELQKLDDYEANAGRIDWNAALFFYGKGITPLQASQKVSEPSKPFNPRGYFLNN